MDKPGGQIGQGPTTVTRGARVPLEDGSFVGSGLIILERACPSLLVEAVVFSPTSTFDNNEDLLWSSHLGPSTCGHPVLVPPRAHLVHLLGMSILCFNAVLLRRVK